MLPIWDPRTCKVRTLSARLSCWALIYGFQGMSRHGFCFVPVVCFQTSESTGVYDVPVGLVNVPLRLTCVTLETLWNSPDQKHPWAKQAFIVAFISSALIRKRICAPGDDFLA